MLTQKSFQHISIIMLIIFSELVGSLLKSLNLKFLKFKIINVDCGDAAAYIWCVYVAFCVEKVCWTAVAVLCGEGMLDCSSSSVWRRYVGLQ